MVATGALVAVLNAMARMVAPLAGTGQLQVDALVKSLIIKQGDWAGIGVGVLTVPLLNAVLTAKSLLAGADMLAAAASLTMAARGAYAGAGGLTASITDIPGLVGYFFTASPTAGGWTAGFNAGIGIGSTASLATYSPGADATSWGLFASGGGWNYFHNSSFTYLPGTTALGTEVLGLAFKLATGEVFFSINGTYYNSAGAATGTTPTSASFTLPAGIYYLGVGLDRGSSISVTNDPVATATKPAGYAGWGGTLSSSNKGAEVVLSNGNLTAVNTSGAGTEGAWGTVGYTH
jgi:hypothetical protein